MGTTEFFEELLWEFHLGRLAIADAGIRIKWMISKQLYTHIVYMDQKVIKKRKENPLAMDT